jgi:hypothetical protein
VIELPAETDLADLGRTTPLARGGAGRIEALQRLDGPPLVLKCFHEPGQVDGELLRRFVAWRRELPVGERARLDRCTVWPLATVVRRGTVVGFVMRRVPDAFTDAVRLPSGGHRKVLREAQYLLADQARMRRLRLPAVPARGRLEVVRSLAETVAFLHARRIVVGDLSARNVLWSPDPGTVLLVDCDSFTLGGLGSPLPPSFTVDWDDPAQPADHAASADVYKLGLFALRVLARSFQTRDPAAAATALDPTGALLLRGSLSPDPAVRPNARAWERWASGRRATTTHPKEHIHD